MKILRVTTERITDDNPDLSYLGEYSSSPGPDEAVAERESAFA